MGYKINPSQGRGGIEHNYWVNKIKENLEARGYKVKRETKISPDQFVDLVAERNGEEIVIEVETGKSDLLRNLKKLYKRPFLIVRKKKLKA